MPDVAAAERLIDAGTRAIVLVTPNNPTGAIYPPATVSAFAELCRSRGIVLDPRRDLPRLRRRAAPRGSSHRPRWRDTTIGLYSFSKAYCVPGHRLGALTAGEAAMGEIEKILDTHPDLPPARRPGRRSPGRIDALADWRAGNRLEIDGARHRLPHCFRGAERLDHRFSLGSYFAFVRHPFAGRRAAQVAKALVEERGVLCLPGPYFGPDQETHLRIAFANAGVAELSLLRERLSGFSPP